MTIDSVLRAIGALTSLYAIGLLVALTSTAALDAVTSPDHGILCADRSCAQVASAQHHHATPAEASYPQVIHTAALFFTGTYD